MCAYAYFVEHTRTPPERRLRNTSTHRFTYSSISSLSSALSSLLVLLERRLQSRTHFIRRQAVHDEGLVSPLGALAQCDIARSQPQNLGEELGHSSVGLALARLGIDRDRDRVGCDARHAGDARAWLGVHRDVRAFAVGSRAYALRLAARCRCRAGAAAAAATALSLAALLLPPPRAGEQSFDSRSTRDGGRTPAAALRMMIEQVRLACCMRYERSFLGRADDRNCRQMQADAGRERSARSARNE